VHEAEESLLLEAVAREQSMKTEQDEEDSVGAVVFVKCRD
jgi:hypothetical protein